MEPLAVVLLGVGLAGAAGFRVFVPPLVLAVGHQFGLTELPAHADWLSSPLVIAVLAIATVVEVMAYYIPLVDNLLDLVATPLALGAGTLLVWAVMPELEPWLHWTTALLVGGGAAGSVQALTSLTRITSTGATGGLGNPVVATGELAGAAGLSLLALVAPLLAGLTILVIVVVGLRAVAGRRRWGQKH